MIWFEHVSLIWINEQFLLASTDSQPDARSNVFAPSQIECGSTRERTTLKYCLSKTFQKHLWKFHQKPCCSCFTHTHPRKGNANIPVGKDFDTKFYLLKNITHKIPHPHQGDCSCRIFIHSIFISSHLFSVFILRVFFCCFFFGVLCSTTHDPITMCLYIFYILIQFPVAEFLCFIHQQKVIIFYLFNI